MENVRRMPISSTAPALGDDTTPPETVLTVTDLIPFPRKFARRVATIHRARKRIIPACLEEDSMKTIISSMTYTEPQAPAVNTNGD